MTIDQAIDLLERREARVIRAAARYDADPSPTNELSLAMCERSLRDGELVLERVALEVIR